MKGGGLCRIDEANIDCRLRAAAERPPPQELGDGLFAVHAGRERTKITAVPGGGLVIKHPSVSHGSPSGEHGYPAYAVLSYIAAIIHASAGLSTQYIHMDAPGRKSSPHVFFVLTWPGKEAIVPIFPVFPRPGST